MHTKSVFDRSPFHAADDLLRLRRWIGCPEYREPYERARRIRQEATGDWFLKHESYTAWRDKPFSLDRSNDTQVLKANWLERILSLEGECPRNSSFQSLKCHSETWFWQNCAVVNCHRRSDIWKWYIQRCKAPSTICGILLFRKVNAFSK